MKLPLADLPWQYFEEFVLEAVRVVDDLEECWFYGRQGQRQHGLDLVGFHSSGRRSVYQVRQEQRVAIGRIEAAVQAYVSAGRRFDADRFVYVTSASARDTALQDGIDALRRSLTDIDLAVFDSNQLALAVRDHDLRSLVARYFGPDWVGPIFGSTGIAYSSGHGGQEALATYARLLRDAMKTGPAYSPGGLDLLSVRQPVRLRAIGEREAREAAAPDRIHGLVDKERPSYRSDEDFSGDGPSLNWEELLASADRLVVLGDPGAGKSWLLRFAALTHGSQEKVVPIHVSLSRLAARSGDMPRDIAEAALSSVGMVEAPARREEMVRAIAAAVESGHALLLCDGLDEVPPARLEEVRRLLAEAGAIGGLRLVLTSRFAGYPGFPFDLGENGREVEVVGFGSPEVDSFIRAWFGDRPTGARVRDRILGDAGLGELARSPLLLSFVCLIAQDQGEIPSSRVALLESILHLLLSRLWRGQDASSGHVERTSAKLKLLSRLAYAGAEAGFPLWMSAEFVSETLRSSPDYEWLEKSAPLANGLVHELSRVDGILIPAAPGVRDPLSRGLYCFQHRLLMDYCVARHMAELDGDETLAVVEQRATGDAQWYEPLTLLPARMMDQGENDRVLDVLARLPAGARPDPFHWRLLLGAAAVARCGSGLEVKLRAAVVDAVEVLLYSRASIDRSRAAKVLAQMGADAVEVLAEALEAPYLYPGTNAVVQALAQCGSQGRAKVLEILESTEPESLRVRDAAVDALVGVGATEAVEPLAKLLRSAEWGDNFSHQVAAALAGLGPPGVQALADCLGSDNVETVQQALQGLGRAGPDAEALVVPSLRDDRRAVRAAAVEAIARCGGEKSVDSLRGLLSDEEFQVRVALANAAQFVGPAAALLLTRLARDGTTDVRYEVAGSSALGAAGEPVLLELMEDEAPGVRWKACHAASRWQRNEGDALTKALTRRLTDPEQGVRIAAATALRSSEGRQVALADLKVHAAAPEPPEGEKTAWINYELMTMFAGPVLAKIELRHAALQRMIALAVLAKGRGALFGMELIQKRMASIDMSMVSALALHGETEQRRKLAILLPLLPAERMTWFTQFLLLGDRDSEVRELAASGRALVPDLVVDAIAHQLERPEHHPDWFQAWEVVAETLLRLDPSVAEGVMKRLIGHDGLGRYVTAAIYQQRFREALRSGSAMAAVEPHAVLTLAMLIGEPDDRAAAELAERRWLATLERGVIPRICRQELVDVRLRWPGRAREALEAAKVAGTFWPGWIEYVQEANAHCLCGDLGSAARSLRRAIRISDGDLQATAKAYAARVAIWRGALSSAAELLVGLDDHAPRERVLMRLCLGDGEQPDDPQHLPAHLQALLAQMEGQEPNLAPTLEIALAECDDNVERHLMANDVDAVMRHWQHSAQMTPDEANEITLAVSQGQATADARWLG